MIISRLLNPARVRQRREDAPDTSKGSSSRRDGDPIAGRYVIGTTRRALAVVSLTVGIAALSVPTWAQTADDLAKQYKIEIMEQALQTKERFDLYGLRFESNQSTIPASAQSLLDDIATTLKNFPEWRLRIVGHTDATGDPQPNEALSLARADAIKAGLVDRGVDELRLATAGAGEKRPVTANNTPGDELSTAGSSLFGSPTRRRPSDCSKRCQTIRPRRKQYRLTTTPRSRW